MDLPQRTDFVARVILEIPLFPFPLIAKKLAGSGVERTCHYNT